MSIKFSKATWGFIIALVTFAILRAIVPLEGALATIVLIALQIGVVFTLTQEWWRRQEDKTTRHWR